MDLHGTINSNNKPLNILSEKELCPGSSGLDFVNKILANILYISNWIFSVPIL